jgi:hypothetical protein
MLTDENWKVKTTVFWGQRDRWLSYDGVEDFCSNSNHKLVELPLVQTVLSSACSVQKNLEAFFPLIVLFFPFFVCIYFQLLGKVELNCCALQAGHHVQEDCGEELGQLISKVISQRSQI